MSADADQGHSDTPDDGARPGERSARPFDETVRTAVNGATMITATGDSAGDLGELPGTSTHSRQLGETVELGAPPGAGAEVADDTSSVRPTQPADERPGHSHAGRELGSVRLIREIGRGGMGTVYRGHDRLLGRDVAVKFLRDMAAPDPSAVARFLDEMRAAAAVRHPNLVPVYHADVDAAAPYLVMEYIDGPTLRRLVERTGALAVELALVVLADVAAAVAALHERGLLHRDLKPANVLIDEDGHARVTDFGLAARLPRPGEATSTTSIGAAAGEAAGTPLYMAPELFDGRASPRSDVYAMGMTAFEVLTGRRPFAFERSASVEDVRAAHASRALPVEWLVEHAVPPQVIELIERASHKQAMFRYKSAQEFLRALKAAAGGDGSPAERARMRARLCRVVLRCKIGETGEGQGAAAASVDAPSPTPTPSAPTASSTPTVTPLGTPTPASYAETLARIAAAKREVRSRGAPTEPLPSPAVQQQQAQRHEAVRAIRLPQDLRPPMGMPLPPLPAPAPAAPAAPPRRWLRWPWQWGTRGR